MHVALRERDGDALLNLESRFLMRGNIFSETEGKLEQLRNDGFESCRNDSFVAEIHR